MNEFVLLTEFPKNAKAIGPYFDSASFYSLEKETYLSYDEIFDQIEIDDVDNDSYCEFGKVLFSVSRIDDSGEVIKCSEDAFFDNLKSDGSVLGLYSFDDADRIIEIFSALRDKAVKELSVIVSRKGCDAHYPTFFRYFFNEEYGIVGCQLGGSGYVLNGTPDFKKYPNLIKL